LKCDTFSSSCQSADNGRSVITSVLVVSGQWLKCDNFNSSDQSAENG
jgi:hypothetical protein